MATLIAFLPLIGTIVSLVVMLIKQYYVNTANPQYIRQQMSQQIDKEIINYDSNAANMRLQQWLSTLRGNQPGQSSSGVKS